MVTTHHRNFLLVQVIFFIAFSQWNMYIPSFSKMHTPGSLLADGLNSLTRGPARGFAPLERNCGSRGCAGHRGGSLLILCALAWPLLPPWPQVPCLLAAPLPPPPPPLPHTHGTITRCVRAAAAAPVASQEQGEMEKPRGQSGPAAITRTH